jgi:hypothetical protein
MKTERLWWTWILENKLCMCTVGQTGFHVKSIFYYFFCCAYQGLLERRISANAKSATVSGSVLAFSTSGIWGDKWSSVKKVLPKLKSKKSSPLKKYINHQLFSCWTFETIIWKCLLKTSSDFSVNGRCSLVPTSYWLQRKCARINLSQAASGMIIQNHRQLPVNILSVIIAAFGSLKRVTGNIFKISK